MIRIKPMYV